MKAAVRYMSRHGNTEKIAKAIASGINTKAVSIIDEPSLKDKADVLFLGGAPYANIMDPKLKEYAEKLDSKKVGRVVLFTTSNWSKRTVNALRKILIKKSITVEEEYFFAWSIKIDSKTEEAKEFGIRHTAKA